jgi:hypothetical protein
VVRTYELILHERTWAVLAATKGMERRRLFALLVEVKVFGNRPQGVGV